MAVSKSGFLVGLFVFLCLSLSSANRVLKDNDAENDLTGNDLSSGQDDQLHGFSHAGLKGGIPKFSSVGSTNGCCNYGSNCGQNGYVCPPNYGCSPPNYGCGGNSGCQSCYTCSPCQWQGSPPPCGCETCIDNTEVQHESTLMSDPDPPIVRAIVPTQPSNHIPPTQPENHNIKSNGGANQNIKSNGGLV